MLTTGDNSYLLALPQLLDRNIFQPLRGVMSEAPLVVDLIGFAALGAAAAYSAMEHKGSRMPRWDNLLWWSYSVFVQWNSSANPPVNAPVAPPVDPGESDAANRSS